MSRNTSVILGNHFSSFIKNRVEMGRFDNTSEAVRAGLRLLEVEEEKLDALRERLLQGQAQLDNGEGVDGETFMQELMKE